MLQRTPENEIAVIVPFKSINTNESVVVDNCLTSSVMRWSGLVSSPAFPKNR